MQENHVTINSPSSISLNFGPETHLQGLGVSLPISGTETHLLVALKAKVTGSNCFIMLYEINGSLETPVIIDPIHSPQSYMIPLLALMKEEHEVGFSATIIPGRKYKIMFFKDESDVPSLLQIDKLVLEMVSGNAQN